jgi:hypothetical protein
MCSVGGGGIRTHGPPRGGQQFSRPTVFRSTVRPAGRPRQRLRQLLALVWRDVEPTALGLEGACGELVESAKRHLPSLKRATQLRIVREKLQPSLLTLDRSLKIGDRLREGLRIELAAHLGSTKRDSTAGEGFEPSDGSTPSAVFKTAPFVRSGTPPRGQCSHALSRKTAAPERTLRRGACASS